MAADVAALRRLRTRPGWRWSSTRRGARTSAFTATSRQTALAQGADAMLTSTHKTAGSLTQSAMLHVADSGADRLRAIGRALRLLRSTSPVVAAARFA